MLETASLVTFGILTVAVAIAVAIYLLGRDGGGYEPRLTGYFAEGLAAKVAFQPGSSTLIGCEVIEFREESRQWLVECQQEKKTRWLVNDETQEVRPEGGASGSPAETPV